MGEEFPGNYIELKIMCLETFTLNVRVVAQTHVSDVRHVVRT
jgi:hypothetical protein